MAASTCSDPNDQSDGCAMRVATTPTGDEMIKAGIDQDAITKMFSDATAKQGDTLRKGVAEATLKALQGRELTMENIKKVLKTVTTAATAGAGKNLAGSVDIEAMLGKAVAGMD